MGDNNRAKVAGSVLNVGEAAIKEARKYGTMNDSQEEVLWKAFQCIARRVPETDEAVHLRSCAEDLKKACDQRDYLDNQIRELLARAARYSDKPHQLFSHIWHIAKSQMHDEAASEMDAAYAYSGSSIKKSEEG